MDQLRNIITKYQEAAYIRQDSPDFKNELNYINSAIEFFKYFPADLYSEGSILSFKEDEIEYLAKRKELLVSAGGFSDSFFQQALGLFQKYPLSYVKHSLLCDFIFFETNKMAFPLGFLKTVVVDSKFENFNCYDVANFLFRLNQKEQLGLIGYFWNLDQECVHSQFENRDGYFDGYIPTI